MLLHICYCKSVNKTKNHHGAEVQVIYLFCLLPIFKHLLKLNWLKNVVVNSLNIICMYISVKCISKIVSASQILRFKITIFSHFFF